MTLAVAAATIRRMSLSHLYSDELRALIAERLSRFDAASPVHPAGLVRAAVVIAVLPAAAATTSAERVDAAFLLTRRAATLRAHGGQLALPGGRIDQRETIAQAALRELSEELGINLGPEAILGTLDDYPTRSGYLISPLVVWTPPGATPIPNPAEVAQVYRIPLVELRRSGSPEIFAIPESDRPVLRLPMPLIGTDINAPTAAMLYQFREVALEGRITRVGHFDQPVWAWS